jgi:predicted nucleic acid-binding protein
MHKPRIYIDTSVIGGCFDEEFAEWSNKLFDEFIEGKKIAVISDITTKELVDAPEHVKNIIDLIPSYSIITLKRDEEIDYLALKYIEYKVISEKSFNDALHIAFATVNNVDLLVSWNFKHIVNFDRILKYNSVNLMFGYKHIEIRNPKEVISNDENF